MGVEAHVAFGARASSGCLVLLSLVVALGRASVAYAQSPSAQSTESPDAGVTEVVPPRVAGSFDAAYPPEALAARVEGTVVLSVTIDKSGHVVEVKVSEPAGHGFDESALEAVRKFRFEPAQRSGVPIGARILYRYTFRLPETPAAAAPVATTPPPQTTAAAPQLAGATPKASSPQPVEVRVRGQQSEARRLRESAEAVRVVEIYRARQQPRDLGDVLAAVEGVSIRRGGGLGSLSRLSLNGLTEQQIRIFVDDVPVDSAGFPLGIASYPVNLLERVEIYKGVLPIRFGADALGGALNLVSARRYETGAYASYQRGEFGTTRSLLSGRYHHEPSGFFVGGGGWLDYARNDYEIDVPIADRSGRLTSTRVKRLHDAYRAYGGSLDFGFVDTPWAKRLSVLLFGSTYDKEFQHNRIMTVPFGEARFGETAFGATLRYDQPILPALSLSSVMSVSHRTFDFIDLSEWVYDWNKRRVRPRNVPGEVGRGPHDLTVWQDGVFGRAQLEWRVAPDHALRFASTARYSTRIGEERAAKNNAAVDPLAGRRNLLTLTTGIEHELNALDMPATGEEPDPSRDRRLQVVAFMKHYLYSAFAEKDSALAMNTSADTGVTRQKLGFGAGARLRFTSWLLAKTSYEWATRFPSTDELYGNGMEVLPNLELLPETSHNANAGLQLRLPSTPLGAFTAEVNSFFRDTHQLMAQAVTSVSLQYKNLYSSRTLGVEGSSSWTSPGSWVVIEGNCTWQDVRNNSDEGEFAKFSGDRIPNRPWLFANWSGRIQWRGALLPDDELSPYYSGRYVHDFFLNWESVGDRNFKAIIPEQVAHVVGVSYTTRGEFSSSVALEANVSGVNLSDFWHVQLPGRSISLKVTGEI